MICVPIQAISISELKRKINKISPQVDLIEIWVDHLPSAIAAKDIIGITGRKVVVVNKPKREKGKWSGTEENRVERLIEFAKAGVAYIDIGIDTDPKLIKKLSRQLKRETKLIISYHNFRATPPASHLQKIVKKARTHRPDVVKVAVYAKSVHDNFRILQLLESNLAEKKAFVALAMGPFGKISRVAGLALGNHINYISADKNNMSAPGQISFQQYQTLKQIIEFT